jgi:hypothetical protein
MLSYLNASTIYVSQTEGNDAWTGFYDKPQPRYGFGPLQTLERATAMVAKMRATGNSRPVSICVIGDYCLERPIRLGSAYYRDVDGLGDGAFPSGDLVVEGNPVRKGRIIGGRKITSLREGQINGVRCLCADIPAVRDGSWSFSEGWAF